MVTEARAVHLKHNSKPRTLGEQNSLSHSDCVTLSRHAQILWALTANDARDSLARSLTESYSVRSMRSMISSDRTGNDQRRAIIRLEFARVQT
jgi:hypothetical protein